MPNFIEISFNPDEFESIKNQFIRLEEKQSDFTQELYDVGIYLLRSQDLNFAEQGRPDSWTSHPSYASIQRQGMVLVDTGRLRRSVSVYGDPDNVFELSKNSLTIGSEVSYGMYLQPEWPFLMIQDEDIPIIEDIILRGIEAV